MPGINQVTIATDGAYSQSREMGGYAFVMYIDNDEVARYMRPVHKATNNIAEMMAMLSALRYVKAKGLKCTIISDSMYVIGGLTLGWSKEANKALWDQLCSVYGSVKDQVEIKHVKGHASNDMNNSADLYAVLAGGGY